MPPPINSCARWKRLILFAGRRVSPAHQAVVAARPLVGASGFRLSRLPSRLSSSVCYKLCHSLLSPLSLSLSVSLPLSQTLSALSALSHLFVIGSASHNCVLQALSGGRAMQTGLWRSDVTQNRSSPNLWRGWGGTTPVRRLFTTAVKCSNPSARSARRAWGAASPRRHT